MASGVARGNGLLPLLAIVVVVMALYVGFQTMKDEGGLLQGLLDTVPIAPDPDADTPAETIRTLSARVADMTAELQAVRKDNEASQRSREQLRRELRQALMADWKAEQARQKTPDDGGLTPSVMARIEALSNRIATLDRSSKLPEVPEAVPVPGYATTFPLYEGVEYALPGEVARYGQR